MLANKYYTVRGKSFLNLLVIDIIIMVFSVGSAVGQGLPQNEGKIFRAGAAVSNITPNVGSSINGSMQDHKIRTIHDDTFAKSIVLDDGSTRLAVVVSDLCLIYREQLDAAKQRAKEFTGIPVENMLMTSTHTHSAGTACSVLKSDPDTKYLKLLEHRIADAVIRANENLEPTRIGWAESHEPTQVFNRRWRMKPGKVITNPFVGTDQIKINASVGNPDLLEPAEIGRASC